MHEPRIVLQEPDLEKLRKDYLLVDMHVHSKHSYDGLSPVKSIIRRATELGIGISITDHSLIKGSLQALKSCEQKKKREQKTFCIPGIEVASSENKELLMYFYKKKDLEEFYNKNLKNKLITHKATRTGISGFIRSMKTRLSMQEIIEKADKYPCLKSIPHPYSYFNRSSYLFFARKKREQLLKHIPAVEVLNAAHRRFMNNSALAWARKRNKAFTGGSDAHSMNEIGSALTGVSLDLIGAGTGRRTAEDFLELVRKKKNIIIGKEIRFPTALKHGMTAAMEKRKRFSRH